MLINKSKFQGDILVYAYMILLIMTRILPNISSINAIVYALFCCLYFFLLKHSFSFCLKILPILLIISIFSYANGSGMLYILIDVSIAYFILASILVYDSTTLVCQNLKLLNKLSFIVFILSLFAMLFPANYIDIGGDIRFIGFFKYGNLSASIVSILCVLYWETFNLLYKNAKRKTVVLFFLICFFVSYIFLCKTRSLLFFLPYWIYQIYLFCGKRIFFAMSVFCVALVSFSMFDELKVVLRINEDASFLTRESLSIFLLDGIRENYFIFPHGARKSTDFFQTFFNDESLTPHNDFLRYYYDWGFAFLLLILFMFNDLKKRKCFDFGFIFISLGYCSFALHNMLFLPYLLLPYLFILIIKKQPIIRL